MGFTTSNFDAKTALDQLTQSNNGVGRLVAMTGAKDFVKGSNFVQFGFKSCRKANKCSIELKADDTYTVRFYKYNRRTLDCPLVHEFEGAYCDMLKEIFESFTGLYLSLS
jgi:hypothetical protein